NAFCADADALLRCGQLRVCRHQRGVPDHRQRHLAGGVQPSRAGHARKDRPDLHSGGAVRTQGRSVDKLGRLVAAAAARCLCLAAGGPVRADIGSDHPAAILVFPKILVQTATGLDTLIRIGNVSDTPINVYCFYVNATPICSIPGGSCFPNQLSCQATVGGQIFIGSCLEQWQPNDFIFRLTKDQPTGWLVSEGQSTNCPFLDGVCSNDGPTSCRRNSECGPGSRCVLPPCFPLDGTSVPGSGGQTNEGAIPLSPDDPFVGELKCIAVDENQQPVARN